MGTEVVLGALETQEQGSVRGHIRSVGGLHRLRSVRRWDLGEGKNMGAGADGS